MTPLLTYLNFQLLLLFLLSIKKINKYLESWSSFKFQIYYKFLNWCLYRGKIVKITVIYEENYNLKTFLDHIWTNLVSFQTYTKWLLFFKISTTKHGPGPLCKTIAIQGPEGPHISVYSQFASIFEDESAYYKLQLSMSGKQLDHRQNSLCKCRYQLVLFFLKISI